MSRIQVMVNGIPGQMGQIVAETVVSRGLELVPYSLTGPGIPESEVTIAGMQVALVSPENRDAKIVKIKATYPRMICVDYTHPTAVNANGAFYVQHGLPFVMGTTGGDREALHALVDQARLACVIAPNMAKQIVALQSMMAQAAQDFPGAFEGYTLTVRESHQSTKADTSGTAKAIVQSFRGMGLDYSVEQIELIRNPDQQLAFGVPEEALKGHAFHTYHLASKDDTVHFEFQHNVVGRKVYAEGTVDAVVFLGQKIEAGETARRWSMMDILRAGAMQ